MSLRLTALAACLAALPVAAQEIIVESLEDGITLEQVPVLQEKPIEIKALSASGAALRGLDRLTGETQDFTLQVEESVTFGKLRVDLEACRYPEDNEAGEAYAFLTILEGQGEPEPVFQGWMIASSPALNALDHARYDVWVLRCSTS